MSLSRIFKNIKRALYFFVAAYFGFFAAKVLKRWNPKIVTVVGSSGKTTLLHLFEAQLGEKAVYSHKANSTFGIPFHILGLERKTFSVLEWPMLIALAPFKVFRTVPTQKLYVTEADAERPGEGQFLAKLLKPHVLVWLSLGETHGVNFDRLVRPGEKVEQAIAREFGFFLEQTRELAVLDSDNPYITAQTKRSSRKNPDKKIISVSEKEITKIVVGTNEVLFSTADNLYAIPKLVPKAVGVSVLAVVEVLKYLDEPINLKFTNFYLPPGRSSVFVGIKGTTLIDSTYNATIDGMRTMLELFTEYPAGEKWLVLGDMIEQGKSEQSEHKLLAYLIEHVQPNRVILVGPRLTKHTYPILKHELGSNDALKVETFMRPDEALEYLEKNLAGGETILFKGARFLEGVVEKLLNDPADAAKLCRRESVWVARRKQWGV